MVAEAVSSGGIISTADCVKRVLIAYPKPGLSRGQIADEVMMAAGAAGIRSKLGRSCVKYESVGHKEARLDGSGCSGRQTGETLKGEIRIHGFL